MAKRFSGDVSPEDPVVCNRCRWNGKLSECSCDRNPDPLGHAELFKCKNCGEDLIYVDLQGKAVYKCEDYR